MAVACERARELVAAHDYALPEDVQRDVDEVYEAACTDLMEAS
jgi:hypothetical protein